MGPKISLGVIRLLHHLSPVLPACSLVIVLRSGCSISKSHGYEPECCTYKTISGRIPPKADACTVVSPFKLDMKQSPQNPAGCELSLKGGESAQNISIHTHDPTQTIVCDKFCGRPPLGGMCGEEEPPVHMLSEGLRNSGSHALMGVGYFYMYAGAA